jgi:hypothetical protein
MSLSKDKQACVYCGSQDNLTIDHVVPKSRWRQVGLKRRVLDNSSNLVTACRACNAEKANMLPASWFEIHPEYQQRFFRKAKYLSDKVKVVINPPQPRQEGRADETHRSRPVECKICGAFVRQDRINTHVRRVHPLPSPVERQRPKFSKTLVKCTHCAARVRIDRLEKHLQKVHHVDKKSLAECPVCNVKVRIDRLAKHVQEIHSPNGP